MENPVIPVGPGEDDQEHAGAEEDQAPRRAEQGRAQQELVGGEGHGEEQDPRLGQGVVPQHHARHEPHRRRPSRRGLLVGPQVEQEQDGEQEDDHHLLGGGAGRRDQVRPEGEEERGQARGRLAEAAGERVDRQDRSGEQQEIGDVDRPRTHAEEPEMNEQNEGVARRPLGPFVEGGPVAEAVGQALGQVVVGEAVGGERRGEEHHPGDAQGDPDRDHQEEPEPDGEGREAIPCSLGSGRQPVADAPEEPGRGGGEGQAEQDADPLMASHGEVPHVLGDRVERFEDDEQEQRGEQPARGGGPSCGAGHWPAGSQRDGVEGGERAGRGWRVGQHRFSPRGTVGTAGAPAGGLAAWSCRSRARCCARCGSCCRAARAGRPQRPAMRRPRPA